METIVNKVAQSGLITLDLADFLPSDSYLTVFDLKPFLFREMILREKDYRSALQVLDWEKFRGKSVGITCSTEAIIPMWAYMLAASGLETVADFVCFADKERLREELLIRNIEALEAGKYSGERVIIKGCGDTSIPESAYVAITRKLKPYVKTLMYGEPCSTVPVYKKK